MTHLRIGVLAATAFAVAAPAAADAASAKRCDGIGKVVTNLRARGLPCDDARTLSAKWAETAAAGSGRVVRIDGFRCARHQAPGPRRAVRCAKRHGAVAVTFRVRLP